jgi:hypothetical protein
MGCQGDAPCECVIDCYEAGGDPFGCFDMCGGSAPTQALVGCVAAGCQEQCV